MVKSLKLKCNITGKSSLFSGDYLKKKIEEYKDIDTQHNLYVSRDVKTLFKRGYNFLEIRNILNVSEDIELPSKDKIEQIEGRYKTTSLKIPTINENLSGFTYNKSDPEVESFINNYIIKV